MMTLLRTGLLDLTKKEFRLMMLNEMIEQAETEGSSLDVAAQGYNVVLLAGLKKWKQEVEKMPDE